MCRLVLYSACVSVSIGRFRLIFHIDARHCTHNCTMADPELQKSSPSTKGLLRATTAGVKSRHGHVECIQQRPDVAQRIYRALAMLAKTGWFPTAALTVLARQVMACGSVQVASACTAPWSDSGLRSCRSPRCPWRDGRPFTSRMGRLRALNFRRRMKASSGPARCMNTLIYPDSLGGTAPGGEPWSPKRTALGRMYPVLLIVVILPLSSPGCYPFRR
jgi:hypothetical protein